MSYDPQFFYMMLALPTLFGMTLVGEGIYKMSHYESGWFNMLTGIVFLCIVAFGFFYLQGYV
jgi:hypothetical protein